MFPTHVAGLAVVLLTLASGARADDWSVAESPGTLAFSLGGVAVVEYVYADETISRPYFTRLRSPAGVQVTRSHPPVAGEDRMDHPDFHPGVWMAFGDINGADFWRLDATVKHDRFIQPAESEEGVLSFATEERYLDADGALVCQSLTRHTLRRTPLGIVVTYDTTFFGDKAFTFGDQEEMGLGVRLATPLRVEAGGPNPAPTGTGEIAADGGRRGSAQIWGTPTQWLDYRGRLEGEPAGVAIFCHSGNFRASRMHARDYGFVCANPFGIAAFKARPASRVTVRPGESLRLRYAVVGHSGTTPTDGQLDQAYQEYVSSER
ncbi:DUF6807 family protein [Botrimarina colliarenosi]|uniref:DUF6807 family protein n=1 Tax=Botrimarina colliarenosi TaxID=2528001 RepID=UPI0018D44A76|nr:DUF6807 family protein [Botrimarina colliarenosi]